MIAPNKVEGHKEFQRRKSEQQVLRLWYVRLFMDWKDQVEEEVTTNHSSEEITSQFSAGIPGVFQVTITQGGKTVSTPDIMV